MGRHNILGAVENGDPGSGRIQHRTGADGHIGALVLLYHLGNQLVRIGHGEAQLHGGHATGHASVCNLGSLLHRLRTDHSHDPNIFNFVQNCFFRHTIPPKPAAGLIFFNFIR